MLYTVDLTIPANTPKSSWVCKDITVKEGVLNHVSVLIPAGHHALAHLVILDGQTQIIPHNPGSSIHGDNEVVTFRTHIPIPEPERKLTICGWNEDTDYDHTFYVRLNILPPLVANPSELIYKLLHVIFKRMRLLPRGWRSP